MNAITEIEASPIATFEKLVATSASRLESIRAAIAETEKLPAGLSADDEIAARKANAAKLEELRLEEGVFAARLEHHKEGLATARKVVAEQVKVEAKEQALTEGKAALERVAAARAAYLAAVQELGEVATASARRGAKFGFIPELHFAVQEEAGQLGLVQVALFNTSNA